MDAPSDNITATRRALSLPEIVSEIIAWIHADTDNDWPASAPPQPNLQDFKNPSDSDHDNLYASDSESSESHTYYYSRTGVLFRCALVNRLWFHATIPALWEEDLDWSFRSQIPDHLTQVEDPSRRQMYANYIKRANLTTVPEACSLKYAAALGGLQFPRLEYVKLICPGADWQESSNVPPLLSSRVKVLDIDPRFEWNPITYCVKHAEWDELFEQIPKVFPNLETVTFMDCARVFPGALERFAKGLPRLKSFDHHCVVENNDIYSLG
ncbi:uncharacterized protein BO97DRAFT_408295 [Aspergillus homomorphus CBS 101889]|uniref:F-box domain protein n=1 Tax=Aspergillus homomorphus (strain CBS 101889) TaxID=1450537 RepID=A0A395HKS8_ASPHC|nr:hypothetical protein BO97DRAFT_408295 [Aspergillus homomorphus CBS 101889]RAL08447.1 hypothetical protein BO97DRAFT_408295 [Aspergillus homomorphus CBS 101889]